MCDATSCTATTVTTRAEELGALFAAAGWFPTSLAAPSSLERTSGYTDWRPESDGWTRSRADRSGTIGPHRSPASRMIDPLSLASSASAFLVIAVSPGPATLSNATIAMSRGRRTSLVYGAGLSSGLVFWGAIAASGMGAVLQGSLHLLMILKVLGGLYLLWLAFQSGRAALRPDSRPIVDARGSGWFLRGLMLNLSNPKSVIAWMAALSVGLGPDDGVLAITAATLACIVVGFFVNAAYSVLFSIGGMMRAYRRVRRWIDGAVGVLFSVAGVGLVRSAFARGSS